MTKYPKKILQLYKIWSDCNWSFNTSFCRANHKYAKFKNEWRMSLCSLIQSPKLWKNILPPPNQYTYCTGIYSRMMMLSLIIYKVWVGYFINMKFSFSTYKVPLHLKSVCEDLYIPLKFHRPKLKFHNLNKICDLELLT